MVLVVLGCVLAGPALAAYTMDRQITDQGRYLGAVQPLADDPVVRAEIERRVTDAIAAKLPAAARGLVESGVTKAVESDAFRSAWATINRVAHPRVIAMLRDEPGSLRIEDDTVLLDVGAVSAEVKAQLVAAGVPLADRLPEITAEIPLFSRPAVRRAIPAFGAMQALRIVLPVAVLVLLAASLIISPRRDQTLILTGAGIAAAMLLLALYRWITRSQLVSRSKSPELAGAYYDALTDPLTITLWVIAGVGAAAALTGALIRTRGRAHDQHS